MFKALIIAGWFPMLAMAADPGLSVSKAIYEQKVQAAEQEWNARRNDLNDGYTTTLKLLLRSNQDKGELEPLLAVKAESERFAKQMTVTGHDVVSFPRELADAQRRYLAAQDKLNKDRQLTLARAARAYLDDLEPAKRSLTRIGELDSAIAVNDEIKRVRESVDLTVLDKPAEEAKPVPPPAAAVSPAPVTSIVVNPPGLRPLRDDIWVHALRNGVPVRDLKFTLLPSGARKTLELSTDQLGKISLRSEATSYHIWLLSDPYEFQQVTNATAGNSYQFNIADAVPGSGAVYVRERDREIFLPGAGTVTVSQWQSGDGKTGPAWQATRAVFYAPRGKRPNLTSVMQARSGEPFRIRAEGREYEAVVQPVGPGKSFLIRYTPVN